MADLVAVELAEKVYRAGKTPQEVFSGISVAVARGERVAVAGQNGSGKTTLIRMLLGVEELTDGRRATALDPGTVGYVPQDYRSAVLPWFSLRKNLQLAIPANANPGLAAPEVQPESPAAFESRFSETCQGFRLDIDLAKHPTQLSGGELQIFLVVRALLTAPDLLVLDEPFSAIDYGRHRLIREFIAEWAIAHPTKAMVLISHDLQDAVLLSTRVVILSKRERGVVKDLSVSLPWPRHTSLLHSHECQQIVDQVTAAVLDS